MTIDLHYMTDKQERFAWFVSFKGTSFLFCLYITNNINNFTESNKLECLACAAFQHISKIAETQQFYKQEFKVEAQ